MKILKFSFSLLFVCGFLLSHAQTADEVVAKHIDALGGKQKIQSIKSVYMEGAMNVMGNEAPVMITILNGKGYRSDVDFGGNKIIQAYNDKGGWSVNPMMGSKDPQPMPEDMYKANKDDIFVGGALLDYASKGKKLELAGRENIGTVSTYKLKLISDDNKETIYYVDPVSFYLVRVSKVVDFNGTQGEISTDFSNYKKTDYGFVLPFTMETTLPQGLTLTSTLKKVEINKEVDPKIFEMPAK